MNAKAFRKHLENDIIPFWNKMEDTENGVMAERTMNTLLHVLEAYTELYSADEFYAVGKSIRGVCAFSSSRFTIATRKSAAYFLINPTTR